MGLFLRLGRAGCDPASPRSVFIVFSCSGKAEHFHFAACKVLLLSCSVKDEPSSSRRSWEFDRWTLFFFLSLTWFPCVLTAPASWRAGGQRDSADSLCLSVADNWCSVSQPVGQIRLIRLAWNKARAKASQRLGQAWPG